MYKNRDHPTLKMSQPTFLLIILLGASFGIATIIPFASLHILVTDLQAYNKGEIGIESLSSAAANTACQSICWTLTTGFGLTVPVLVIKTWRLHQIFSKAKLGGTPRRHHVKERDMLEVIGIFFLLAYVILIAWSFTSPMYYVLEVCIYVCDCCMYICINGSMDRWSI